MSAGALLSRPSVRLALVMACLAALLALAGRGVRIQTDFSAFLPPSSTPEQRLLVSQLREGLVSRLMLVALEGGAGQSEAALAETSRALAERLAGSPEFDYVANGSFGQFAGQAEVLLRHRYALSPDMTPEKFSAAGLRAALEEQVAQLASPFGVVSRATLARDPTGEFGVVLRGFDASAMPQQREGVWFSGDGRRAFLIAQTRAAGFDSTRQAEAIARLRGAAAQIDPAVRVILSGPGVFAADSHQRIERDVWLLSLCSMAVILGMLVFIYRSPLPILLVLVPVSCGLLAGVLLVQGAFGAVHAITLGFAATLLGEAVDYPNYLLLNTAPGETAGASARRLRGTLALAVLTTVASALALTLSSFQGLAQLGVLTMAGIVVAGLATRYLLPWLLAGQALPPRPGLLLQAVARPGTPRTARRWPVWLGAIVGAIATLAGAAALAWGHPAWWERDLAGLSPVPLEQRELDASLRRDMGAPEVSFFLASHGDSEAAALRAAQAAQPLLQQWKTQRRIASFDSPAQHLPPPEEQARRLAALPDAATLQKNLREAMRGQPFRAEAFAPFLEEAEAARKAAPVTRASYAGTPLGSKLDALVVQLEGQWLALTPLGGVADAAAAAALQADLAARPDLGDTRLVDLRQVSAQMLEDYRGEALRQAAWGSLLILALLVAGLRSLRRSLRVVLPAAGALVLTAALLVGAGQKLGVFHLVAMLLVLGIGLNYALFFERPPADAEDAARTRLALIVCSVSTTATFGFLALSATPVLRAMGSTVALGAVMALLLSAAWAQRRPPEP